MKKCMDYDSQRQSQRGTDSWEELSKKTRCLHWEEVMETVKKQKETYKLAPPSIRQAIRYMVLLFYSFLPPGQAQEYRTLYTLSAMPPSEIYLVPPTADDRSANLLFLSNDGRQAAIYIGSRLQNQKGLKKFCLTSSTILYTTSTDTWQNTTHVYFINQSPVSTATYLWWDTHTDIHNASSDLHSPFQDTNGQSFEDDHDSCRWNMFVPGIFQRWSGMSFGPTMLRSSFITWPTGAPLLDGNAQPKQT